MNGTVKQFFDTLEEMRTIYPFKDDKTRLQTRSMQNLGNNHLSIVTQDEETGIWIEMSKGVGAELD